MPDKKCNAKYHTVACISGYAILQLPHLILFAYGTIKKIVLDIVLRHEHQIVRLGNVGGGTIGPYLPPNREPGDQQSNESLAAEPNENVNRLVSGALSLEIDRKSHTAENEEQTQLQKMISQLELKLNSKFEQIHRKFEQIDGKFGLIDTTLKSIE